MEGVDFKVNPRRRRRMNRLAAIGAICALLILAVITAGALGRNVARELPRGVQALPTDVNAQHCIGAPDAEELVLAAFRINSGREFWEIFPGFADSPELALARGGLDVIVYRDGWPGMITGQLGRHPQQQRRSAPGTVDVCVETVDGSNGIADQPYIVYGDVPTAGSLVAQVGP